jgi:hypothetical protein
LKSLLFTSENGELRFLIEEQRPIIILKNIETINKEAIEWCFAHGLIMYHEKSFEELPRVVSAPISLFPSPFPRRWYNWAVNIQPLFNILVDKISQDETFLISSLGRYFSSLILNI